MNELMNEGMKDMKRIVMIIMAAVLVALPTMAQQQEWQSTSTMQTSGSALAPQVTAVGATSVNDMATTTTSSPAKAPNGPRRGFDTGGETGKSDQSPIGDAMLPLLAMLAIYCATRVYSLRRL